MQNICNKLWMHTICKKIKLNKLPVDPNSIIALALHTVPDTYVIIKDVIKKKSPEN